jgi:hypothetical protein
MGMAVPNIGTEILNGRPVRKLEATLNGGRRPTTADNGRPETTDGSVGPQPPGAKENPAEREPDMVAQVGRWVAERGPWWPIEGP